MKNREASHKDQVKTYLTPDELYSIEGLLKRKPNEFEEHMFAEMWSEHISYKSSVKWIDELPVNGAGIRVPAREENAGIIDLDENISCVIKMESHNHPTAINPGEAAVGVGNVLRDIISMGARPVAQLNILRFGDLKYTAIKESVNLVIKALGSYSNNFGIPVVGGEILFNDSYAYNPLLNLMAVGLVEKDRIITSALKKPGDLLVLVGRKTTGSGVHGAGFASISFSKQLQHLIPESQLADPQSGKILCDSLLEMNKEGLIAAMQDVGAGGVLCAASEMAFRGKKGLEINLEKIPVSKEGLDPIDILLSQSQEQMLLSVSPESIDQIGDIAEKWDINFSTIGSVNDSGRIRVKYEKELHADLPVSSLVRGGGAPVYLRNMENPRRKALKVSADDVPFPGNLKELAKTMIKHPNVASRKYIYEQFDTMAGLSNMSSFFPSDAGILRIPGSEKLLALSVDGNSRYVSREPRLGTMIAVMEAARNIVCSGGKPVALANGLNFGDPADLHVYFDFSECVRGIKKAAELMKVPVIAGNVSFNNQTRENDTVLSVQPTPVIGMVGIVDNHTELMSVSFRAKGDMIYLLGSSSNDISGSEYLAMTHFIEDSAAPEIDMDKELYLHEIMKELISKGLISSAHDVSLGGLFVALVESCLPNNLGFDITSPAEVRTDAFLFGESQSRIVVSLASSMETEFIDFMMEKDFPFSALGHVTKQELRIDDNSFGFITDYARDFENALGSQLEN